MLIFEEISAAAKAEEEAAQKDASADKVQLKVREPQKLIRPPYCRRWRGRCIIRGTQRQHPEQSDNQKAVTHG